MPASIQTTCDDATCHPESGGCRTKDLTVASCVTQKAIAGISATGSSSREATNAMEVPTGIVVASQLYFFQWGKRGKLPKSAAASDVILIIHQNQRGLGGRCAGAALAGAFAAFAARSRPALRSAGSLGSSADVSSLGLDAAVLPAPT